MTKNYGTNPFFILIWLSRRRQILNAYWAIRIWIMLNHCRFSLKIVIKISDENPWPLTIPLIVVTKNWIKYAISKYSLEIRDLGSYLPGKDTKT